MGTAAQNNAADKRNVLNNNRGVAMILAILIISIIVTLSLNFNASMRSEIASATNMRDNIKLEAVLQSGLNFALAVLAEDPSVADDSYDSLFDTWADHEILSIY